MRKERTLELTLRGVKALLKKELGLNAISLALSDSAMQNLANKKRQTSDYTYPYAFANLGEIAVLKDRTNMFAERKHGTPIPVENNLQSMSVQGFIFPVTCGLELHYFDSDQNRCLAAALGLGIMSVSSGWAFRVHVGNHFYYDARLEIPASTTIPLMEGDNTQHPGATEIVVNLVIHSQIALFEEAAAVNGEKPIVSITIEKSPVSEPYTMELSED